MKDVINDALEALQHSIARTDVGEEEEDDGKAQEDQELLEAINESKEENNGHIGENYVLRFMKEKMRSKPCQNQGFILDGYPKTMEQARDLFAGTASILSLLILSTPGLLIHRYVSVNQQYPCATDTTWSFL